MADMTERLAVARKKAEALKSEIAKAQNDKKDCSIQEAAAQIDLKNLGPGLKARRVLKGHFGKVYAMHWSGDNQNLVSASQVSPRACTCVSASVLLSTCRSLPCERGYSVPSFFSLCGVEDVARSRFFFLA